MRLEEFGTHKNLIASYLYIFVFLCQSLKQLLTAQLASPLPLGTPTGTPQPVLGVRKINASQETVLWKSVQLPSLCAAGTQPQCANQPGSSITYTLLVWVTSRGKRCWYSNRTAKSKCYPFTHARGKSSLQQFVVQAVTCGCVMLLTTTVQVQSGHLACWQAHIQQPQLTFSALLSTYRALVTLFNKKQGQHQAEGLLLPTARQKTHCTQVTPPSNLHKAGFPLASFGVLKRLTVEAQNPVLRCPFQENQSQILLRAQSPRKGTEMFASFFTFSLSFVRSHLLNFLQRSILSTSEKVTFLFKV